MDGFTLAMTGLGALIGGIGAAYTALRGPLRAAIKAIGLIAAEWPALKEAVADQGRCLDALLERMAKVEAHVGLATRSGLRVVPPPAVPRDGEDKEKTR